MIKVSKSPFQSPQTEPQWLEPKIFVEKEENGVSAPHVLNMRPYAHLTTKHAKKEHLVKSFHFTSLCATKKLYKSFRYVQSSQIHHMHITYLDPSS